MNAFVLASEIAEIIDLYHQTQRGPASPKAFLCLPGAGVIGTCHLCPTSYQFWGSERMSSPCTESNLPTEWSPSPQASVRDFYLCAIRTYINCRQGSNLEGVPSYRSFIIKIMHVSRQKYKTWNRLATQLQKYSFQTSRTRGLSLYQQCAVNWKFHYGL